MEARLSLLDSPTIKKAIPHIISAAGALAGSQLPRSTLLLMEIRASQINGCAFCTDMHTKEAIAEGEGPTRLNLVATWREATVFTEAERAALELTEYGTRLADSPEGVPDEVWENAARLYDGDQLGAMVGVIALINTFNRLNVITRQPAGNYQVGQHIPELERVATPA